MAEYPEDRRFRAQGVGMGPAGGFATAEGTPRLPSGSTTIPNIKPGGGLPEGFQRFGNTFTNRGFEGGVPGVLQPASPVQNTGPVSQVGGAGLQGVGMPQTSQAGMPQYASAGGPPVNDWGMSVTRGMSDVDTIGGMIGNILAPGGKSPLFRGGDAGPTADLPVGGAMMGGVNFSTPGTMPTAPTNLGARPQMNVPVQDAMMSSMVGPAPPVVSATGGASVGGGAVGGFSGVPQVEQAATDAAQKIFPYSGMSTGMHKALMDRMSAGMASYNASPEMAGEQRFSNQAANLMDAVRANPDLFQTSITGHASGKTSIKKDPMRMMQILSGVSESAYKQGDARTFQDAQMAQQLLLEEMRQSGAENVAGIQAGSREATAKPTETTEAKERAKQRASIEAQIASGERPPSDLAKYDEQIALGDMKRQQLRALIGGTE